MTSRTRWFTPAASVDKTIKSNSHVFDFSNGIKNNSNNVSPQTVSLVNVRPVTLYAQTSDHTSRIFTSRSSSYTTLGSSASTSRTSSSSSSFSSSSSAPSSYSFEFVSDWNVVPTSDSVIFPAAQMSTVHLGDRGQSWRAEGAVMEDTTWTGSYVTAEQVRTFGAVDSGMWTLGGGKNFNETAIYSFDDFNMTMTAFSFVTDTKNATTGTSFSAWQIAVLGVLAGLTSIVTVGGNLIVLLSFFIERTIRQPTNYFIASLAVSDLIIGAVSMPFYTLYLLADKRWLLGEIVCDLWLSIDYTVCLCSIYTVFCITIDRFCSVKIPAKYRNWRTEQKVLVMVAMTWTIPITVFFTTIFGWQYFVGKRTVPSDECYVQYMESAIFNCLLQVGYFWITLSVMCVLYSGIYRVALTLQRKSEAKQRKMTSLVSMAGREISKIGIGMSQQQPQLSQPLQETQLQHQAQELRPTVKDGPRGNSSSDLLSTGAAPALQPARRITKQLLTDVGNKCSSGQKGGGKVDDFRGGGGGGMGDGIDEGDEDLSSSPAFASDTDHSGHSPNTLTALQQLQPPLIKTKVSNGKRGVQNYSDRLDGNDFGAGYQSDIVTNFNKRDSDVSVMRLQPPPLGKERRRISTSTISQPNNGRLADVKLNSNIVATVEVAGATTRDIEQRDNDNDQRVEMSRSKREDGRISAVDGSLVFIISARRSSELPTNNYKNKTPATVNNIRRINLRGEEDITFSQDRGAPDDVRDDVKTTSRNRNFCGDDFRQPRRSCFELTSRTNEVPQQRHQSAMPPPKALPPPTLQRLPSDAFLQRSYVSCTGGAAPGGGSTSLCSLRRIGASDDADSPPTSPVWKLRRDNVDDGDDVVNIWATDASLWWGVRSTDNLRSVVPSVPDRGSILDRPHAKNHSRKNTRDIVTERKGEERNQGGADEARTGRRHPLNDDIINPCDITVTVDNISNDTTALAETVAWSYSRTPPPPPPRPQLPDTAATFISELDWPAPDKEDEECWRSLRSPRAFLSAQWEDESTGAGVVDAELGGGKGGLKVERGRRQAGGELDDGNRAGTDKNGCCSIRHRKTAPMPNRNLFKQKTFTIGRKVGSKDNGQKAKKLNLHSFKNGANIISHCRKMKPSAALSVPESAADSTNCSSNAIGHSGRFGGVTLEIPSVGVEGLPDGPRLEIQMSSQQQQRLQQRQESTKAASKSENRARKALRTISIILGAFVLCWTPWHILSLVISIYPDNGPLNVLYDISYWLCYLNSPINPLCYAFVNQQFKKTFVRILKCHWRRS